MTRYQLNTIRGVWTGADLTQDSTETGGRAIGRTLALVAGTVLFVLFLALFQQVPPPDWVIPDTPLPSGTGIAMIGSQTLTSTASSTRPPTKTITPTPSQTSTPSSTPTATPTYTPTPTPCFINPPATWVRTTIKPGDTLSGLANRHGTSMAQIMRVNCLIDDRINAGEQIFLPTLLDLQVRSITIGSGDGAAVFVPEPNSIPVPIQIELDNLGNVVANSDELRVEYGIGSSEMWPARLEGVTFSQIPAGRSATLNGVIRLDPSVLTPFSEDVTVRVTANDFLDSPPFPLNLSFPPLTVSAQVGVVDISGNSKPVLYREGDSYRLDLMLTAEVTPPPGYEIKSWSWIKPEGGLPVGDNERPNLNYSLEPLLRDDCIEYAIEISLNVILMYHGIEGGETAPIGSSTEIISSTCS